MAGLPDSVRRAPTAAHAFATAAAAAGNRPALRQAGAVLGYADLAGAAGAAAGWLQARGIGRGDVVATLHDRSPRAMIAVLAAWAVGAAYVHIEATDPDARVAALLATTKARAVFTDERNAGRLAVGAPPVAVFDETATAPYRIEPGLSSGDVAYLVCTSGSTGTPKAVVVAHRALLNYTAAFFERIAATGLDSFGLATTFAADLGKVSVYGALLSGARLDVYRREMTLDPVALAADLRAHPAACLTYTPSQLEALAAEGKLAALLPRKLLVVAGEAFPPRLARAIFAARPELEVHNGYGPSEATILATMHRVVPEDADRPRVPIGTPLAGVRARVLGPDGRPVASGGTGVLHLGGVCLADGYLGEPELTAAKFAGFGEDGTFYRTDDVVVETPGGTLDYLGRADRQLKVRGNRVEPGEVEAVLLDRPGIRQAVVTGESPEAGGPKELVAYVTGTGEPAGLVRALREILPSALVPSRLHFVPTIPVNLNGKTDFAALRAAVGRAAVPPETGEPPRTETERFVLDVWSDVLGRAGIGRADRFLEIGGDSFKALTVFARLRRTYPELVITQLYQHATAAELASALDGTTVPAAEAAVTVVEL
ncbi:non-ribosomal peptide synthetase [Amycolatopsis sp. DSM 110486]|uniref:non-ribosomal peptide synthetase n=1 Tax=Amycolatopsis sp. DSM 110486 TaxID=2865832 RepID=UPI001C699419|nr:non-ribosomal peptide synthetase [Amycolatopsis sp. DSM 110486]QYN21267.1 non-ribosomal peptide synthetase [Amycolatopsis sp. DSM 110486]